MRIPEKVIREIMQKIATDGSATIKVTLAKDGEFNYEIIERLRPAEWGDHPALSKPTC
jgi:hypothetical protein